MGSDNSVSDAAVWLSEANRYFADRIQKLGLVKGLTPTGQFLMRLGAFGYLQSEAIASLTTHSVVFHLQVGSLVRGLLEAWLTAAWLATPQDQNERLRRALGFERESLLQHRSKLEYQAEKTGRTNQSDFKDLVAKEQQLLALIKGSGGVANPPDKKTGMEALQHPDRYTVYRWESDAVHVSSTALGQLVKTQEGVTAIGVPTDPSAHAAKLVMAWDTASDLYEIVMRELKIDLGEWKDLRLRRHADFEALMTELTAEDQSQ